MLSPLAQLLIKSYEPEAIGFGPGGGYSAPWKSGCPAPPAMAARLYRPAILGGRSLVTT
jgi:hypothetical protein